jgi:hypothetical protein
LESLIARYEVPILKLVSGRGPDCFRFIWEAHMFSRHALFLLFCSLLPGTAVSKEIGIIRCDAGMSRVAAWTSPRAVRNVIDYVNCGQSVTVVGEENGYVRIQIGRGFAYIDARYVALSQTQKEPAPEIDEHGKKPAASTPTQGAEDPFSKLDAAQPSATSTGSSRVSRDEEDRQGRHSLGLNFEASSIYYDEPNFMRNKGIMYGLSGDYTYRPNHFMFKMDGRFSFGNMDYWSGRTGTNSGIRDYNFETRFSLGYSLNASPKVVFTPFVGLGYRYLADLSGGMTTTSGASGYDRESNYLYSPLGTEAMLRLKGRWALGLTGEYDLFWHGWQYSEIGDMPVPNPYYIPVFLPGFVAKNDQANGWGARGSIKLVRKLRRIDFAIEPYFRYWNIKDSDLFVIQVVNYGWGGKEPVNNTTEWGSRFGITF